MNEIAIRYLGNSRALAVVAGGLLAAACATGGAVSARQPAPANGATPLDDDLLRDLLPVKKPAGAGEKSPNAASRPAPETAPPTVAPRRVTEPDRTAEEGEDLDAGPAVRLKKIRARMESVRRQLDQGDSSPATQDLQAEIVAELDALLSRLEQAGAKSSSPPSGSAAATAQKPNSTPQPAASKDVSDSSDSARSRESGGAKGVDAQELEREIWGQLPPQLREQLRNTVPERFLPGYEALIESYYRRLAEQRRP